LTWSGSGYFDHNSGLEPLEDAFKYWDWSRFHLADNDVAVLYNTTMRNGGKRRLAARFSESGSVTEFDPPPVSTLAPTPIWRIDRRTRCDPWADAKLIKTLEDTPFYSRSIIESSLFGERVEGMHESLNGPRLRSPVVRALLPFRMPRIV
jgi:carotenoid 1,2-hydratase